MPLIKDDRIVENDLWVFVGDEDDLPDGPIVVSLSRWQAERETLMARNTPLAIKLATLEEPHQIAEDLGKFEMIALDFPAFNNGRAYSYARTLRGRYGYEGEIRAVGDVLRDQLFFMKRCGFDAFQADPRIDLDGYTHALGEFSHVYQPSADGRETVLSLRHRLARAAEARAAAE